MLTDPNLNADFFRAFFEGGYSIRFKRTDMSEERIYSVEQAPELADSGHMGA